jgi:exosome complex component RRP4
MAITIIQPKPAQHNVNSPADSDSDSDSGGGVDLGDPGRRTKKMRRDEDDGELVTPGEVITDDPKWMRPVETFLVFDD